MLNVLLVEDDLDLAASVIDYLELEQIQCDHAADGFSGINLVEKNDYQVIILDVNLPRLDGFSFCLKLRESAKDIPVIMLTARDALQDKVTGFESGADDYLVKPFEIEELLLRVKALAKRRSGQITSLRAGELVLDLKSKTAYLASQPVKITPITIKLLEVLIREAPNPVSRQQLIQAVWGDDAPDSNSLKVHMFNLRKSLARVSDKEMIISVPGMGFRLQP